MKWYLKQLFPLSYVSKYKENGKTYVSVWKMWLGRCYKHRKFEIVKEVSPQELSCGEESITSQSVD